MCRRARMVLENINRRGMATYPYIRARGSHSLHALPLYVSSHVQESRSIFKSRHHDVLDTRTDEDDAI